MDYSSTEHTGLALDWTMAQGLEGRTVEAQLYQLRAKFEPALAAAHDTVSAGRVAVDKLRESAQAGPAGPHDSEVPVEDLWITASVALPRLKNTLRRAEHALTAYALRHGLSRRPMAPEVFESLCQLGLFIVIETMFNAGFLSNADMVAGPLQALVAAALISLTNVAASSAGGYFIGRWLSYGIHTADPDDPYFKQRRETAQFLLIVFASVMALFHLTVGLVRAQETLHGIEHSLARYAEILTTPEALFLVMVGIAMSCVSWKKGMTAFDDPYPGYGDRQCSVEQVMDDLEATFEDLRDQVEARFEEKLGGLNETEKAALKNRAAYNRAVEDYLKSARALERTIARAESQLRAQIAQVAHHHRAARGCPSPAIPETALEPLTSFEHYRAHEPPVFLPVPDYASAKARLADAKTAALERLTALFERNTLAS